MNDPFDTLMAELKDLVEVVEIVEDGASDGSPPGASFWFDGSEFALVYVCEPAERLTVYSKFGELPPDAPAGDYTRLLETNLLLARSSGGAFGAFGVFGAIGTTREVVYAFHVPMRGMSAMLLLDALRHTADEAKAWRLANRPMRGETPRTPPAPLRHVPEDPSRERGLLPSRATCARALPRDGVPHGSDGMGWMSTMLDRYAL
ncbi:CesT family type III secretion system chaperone [Hydrogenophaga sp. 2FB]|uniref:CesT family type III secretion system chaperone n=1 Tax=Hydrogenophaga sp. 2FB TaxID=2502187 RepID=UPI001484FC50|nr:CesT family type III secretion system chaperone [Hydrogenophaga sp. 2FB]